MTFWLFIGDARNDSKSSCKIPVLATSDKSPFMKALAYAENKPISDVSNSSMSAVGNRAQNKVGF